jgi:hypothetical protein
MKIQIHELKAGQVVYDDDPNDFYRVYSNPKLVDGKWEVEVTTSGDYEWVFHEGDVLWTTPQPAK